MGVLRVRCGADLAEAALHTDRIAEGRELLAQVEATAGPRPVVWIELNLRHARALLAPDEVAAQRCFDDAFAADPLPGRLRAARYTFDTPGCLSGSQRARASSAPQGGLAGVATRRPATS